MRLGSALLALAIPGLLTTMAWMLVLSPNVGWVNMLLRKMHWDQQTVKMITIPQYLARSPSYMGLGLSTTPRAPGALPGLSVVNVSAQSPAMKAGLQAGDTVMSFNGKSLDKTSVPEFIGMVASKAVGSVVHVEILRQGVKRSFDVTIEARP